MHRLKRRIKYYIPAIGWIPQYSSSLLGGDILAGFTVASLLVPQSISYALSLAKMNPVAGLFSSSIPGIVYAFLGTSRQLNVAPEAALSLLVGQAITELTHDIDPHSPHAEAMRFQISSVITLQVGLITFLLGVFRLGFLDVVLSRALLRGFVSALAIVISIEQLIPMFGLVELQHQLKPHTTPEKIEFLILHAVPNAHKATTTISLVALAVLVAMRYVKPRFRRYWFIYRIPEVLIVVAVSIVLSEKFKWNEKGVEILGSVPVHITGGFLKSPFRPEAIKHLRRTTSTAAVVSVVGFLDSIVAAKQNGSRYGHSISPNRELVALGASNLVSSFVPGTLPAYGSITRSRINGDVGGRTQMASLVCSAIVLCVTYFFLPLLYYLPKCVLAPVIILVALSLLAETPHDFMFYWRMGAWVDMTMMVLTFTLSVVWQLEAGIAVSVIISLLLVVHRSSKTRMSILGRVPGTERWKPINEESGATEDDTGVLIVRIHDNLDFANTSQLKERLRRLELYGMIHSHPSEAPRRQQASDLVFHLADVEHCDASAVQIFYELLEEYKSRDVGLYITHLRSGPREMFLKAGVMQLLGADTFSETVASAVAHIEMTR